MKVAVFGFRGFPLIQGGVEKHAEELYPEIASKDIKLVIYRRKPYVTSKKRYRGIRFKDIWTIRNKYLETPLHSLMCAIDCIFEKPDVVQIHNASSGPALLITKLFGIKSVLTYHTANYEQDKWGRFSKFCIRLSEKLVFSLADRIIFVSKYYYDKFPQVKHKSSVLPNGPTNFKKYSSNVKLKDLGLKKNEYFMYMGRISPEKRLLDLAEAFSKLHTRKKLLIVGSYDTSKRYYDKLKRYEDKLYRRLVIPGYMQSGDIHTLLKNAYCYVLPSESEAMPIALLEAMSLGICPIASDLPTCRDIIKGDGFVFKVGDIDALTRTLKYAIDHPKKIALIGNSGKARVNKVYNWKTIAKKTADVFRKCIRT